MTWPRAKRWSRCEAARACRPSLWGREQPGSPRWRGQRPDPRPRRGASGSRSFAAPRLLRERLGGASEPPLAGISVCADLPAPPQLPNRPPRPPQLANQHVYSGSADRTVKCWLADTGERVRTFTAHRHSVSALKYHAGTCKCPWPCPDLPSPPLGPCHCPSQSLLALRQTLPAQGLSASPPRFPP